MNVPKLALERVQPSQRQKLWNIFQKFLYEMTNYYDDVMDENGNYRYGYFDSYFEEANREALFILADGTLVGFAMLNQASYLGGCPDHVLAEFTIFPMYRRRRLGMEAARTIFSRYTGTWELKYNTRNTAAVTLWSKATAVYAPNAVRYSADETVLTFSTRQ